MGKHNYSREVDFEQLRHQVAAFAQDRDWDQFHSVRNLILALVGEVGELAEVVQWTSDDKINELLKSGGRERLAQELADVLIYLVRVADKSGVDLAKAVSDKIAENDAKYPKDKARGNAKKYTELRD
jgi:dCTP diphosphatase